MNQADIEAAIFAAEQALNLPLSARTLYLVCDAGQTAQLNYTQR